MKTTILWSMLCVLTAPTNQHVPYLSPSPQGFLFPEITLKFKPINSPTMVPKCLSKTNSPKPLILKLNARRIKLTEKGHVESQDKLTALCQTVSQLVNAKEKTSLKEINSAIQVNWMIRKTNSPIANTEKVLVVWTDQTRPQHFINLNPNPKQQLKSFNSTEGWEARKTAEGKPVSVDGLPRLEQASHRWHEGQVRELKCWLSAAVYS